MPIDKERHSLMAQGKRIGIKTSVSAIVPNRDSDHSDWATRL